MLNSYLQSRFSVDHIPCEVKRGKVAKPCDGIVNHATVPDMVSKLVAE